MRHVVKIEGQFPITLFVETTGSAVRLTSQFNDGSRPGFLLMDPTEATQLAVALLITATGLQQRAKSGDEERGPS